MKPPYRILLVDDSEADNFLHQIVIEEYGCADAIDVVVNGQLALEFMRDGRAGKRPLPQLIFLDINMPVMDGWEFLAAASEEDLFTEDVALVAMLSTSTAPREVAKAQGYRAVKVQIEKPLTPEKLTLVLADIAG